MVFAFLILKSHLKSKYHNKLLYANFDIICFVFNKYPAMGLTSGHNNLSHIWETWRQKIAILIRMQFLNDIFKSRHGFKTAQKFHKF